MLQDDIDHEVLYGYGCQLTSYKHGLRGFKKKGLGFGQKKREETRGRPPFAMYQNGAFKCEKCNLFFQSKKALKKHISNVHRI